jgi:hypothetical protein
MSNKTFKDRVLEEVPNFPEIYQQLLDDYKSRQRRDQTDSLWLDLFGAPFRSHEFDEQPGDDARKNLKFKDRHHFVLRAIKDLGVDQLRIGALVIKDSRVSAALDAGLLTPNDVVPPLSDQASDYDRLADRLKPEYDDPFFWRALLEIFCRAFVAPKSQPWTIEETINFVFDLTEIRHTLPGKKWNATAALQILKRKEPYAKRYSANGSAASAAKVGPMRIQTIVDAIGPMDDDALFVRLRNLFPDAFDRVWNARTDDWMREKHSTTDVLYIAETFLEPTDNTPDGEPSAT